MADTRRRSRGPDTPRNKDERAAPDPAPDAGRFTREPAEGARNVPDVEASDSEDDED
jgi:hypothetical protein